MWLLLGILSFCFLQVSCQYFKTSVVGNRTFAIGSCNLARPDIIFSKEGNKVNISKDVLMNNQKAWIGYTNTSEILQYIGCVKISNLNESIPHTMINTTNDPGQCYSACKHSKMFGMRKTDLQRNCFCFKTDVVSQIKSTRNRCDVPCDNHWFACGNDFNFLSVYTKALIKKEKVNSDKCLAYSASENTTVWGNCDIPRHGVCIKDENDTLTLERTHSSTWERAMDSCFHRNKYPISNKNSSSDQLDYSYWTAYINTLIISDLEDFQTPNIDKYGYIERSGNNIYLRFTEDPTENMVALCSKVPTTSTTTSKEITSTTFKAITLAMSSTGQSSTYISPVASTTKLVEPVNETNQPLHMETQEFGEDKTGLYVAIPLVIIVCVSVAVVGVMCFRKKRGQQPEETEHKEIIPRQSPIYNHVEDEVSYTNTIDRTNGVSMALENNANILKELRQDKINPKLNSPINSINNEDARVIYDFEQEVVDAVPNINMPENSYFVLEMVEKVSDVYFKVDTSVNISPDRITIPSDQAPNTYNKTADYKMDVDNYDHIGAKSMTVNEDGHYDTTFGDDKGESFYDTTNLSVPRHAVNDETYDTTNYSNDYDLTNNTCNKAGNYVNTNYKDVYSFADVTQH